MNTTTIAAVSSVSALAAGAAIYVYGQRKMLDAEKQLIEGMVNGYQLPTAWDNVREVELTVDLGDVKHRVKQRLQAACGVVERVRAGAADWVQNQVHRINEAEAALGDALVHDLGTFRVECKATPIDEHGQILTSDDFDTGEQSVVQQFKEALAQLAVRAKGSLHQVDLLNRACEQVLLQGDLITSQLMLDHAPTDNSALAYALSETVNGTKVVYEVGLVIDGVIFAQVLEDFSVEQGDEALSKKYFLTCSEFDGPWDQLETLLATDHLIPTLEVVEEVKTFAEVKVLHAQGVWGQMRVWDQGRPLLFTLTVRGIAGYDETLGWSEGQGMLTRQLVELDLNEPNLW